MDEYLVGRLEKQYGLAQACVLERHINNLHWLQVGEDGVLEIYLDNHMMQTFRACEARFKHEFIEGWGQKGKPYWFLQFGILVHKLIEIYYINRNNPEFSSQDWAIRTAKDLWDSYEMDSYKEHPKYKELGGFLGLSALLAEYAYYFNAQNEHLRVVATEIYFGKNKEVPLLSDATAFYYAPFRLYLCGKMDLLIDDGSSICPMDHKTSSDFRGKNPLISYEIQDGMTGYVYAASEIVKSMGITKPVNKIVMNFMQVKPAKTQQERFRRLPLYKTSEQLEQYRMRQISTAANIYDMLITERTPMFNTFLCNNYMHQECSFQPVHRLNDEASQKQALASLFQIKPIWNPESREGD